VLHFSRRDPQEISSAGFFSGLNDLLSSIHLCISSEYIYTVDQKKGATIIIAITLSILGRFTKFFHC